MTDTLTDTLTTADFEALKQRQQATWSSGDYTVIGTSLQLVGEWLCEAVDAPAGGRVLDVAAGNGNATLAAARRGCDVVATDYVPELLERARQRADADGLSIITRVADAEALPFEDETFDAVLSTFGVMFAPNQEKAAAELLRVCRRGGRIGLANWTPEGFVGQMFKIIGQHVPPPAGVASPMAWGNDERLGEWFGAQGDVAITRRHFVFRYRSAQEFFDTFRKYYGPIFKAYGALDEAGRASLEAGLVDLAAGANRRTDGAIAVPSEYVEVVVTKS